MLVLTFVQAGYSVVVVKPMDCDYMDELKGRPKSGKGTQSLLCCSAPVLVVWLKWTLSNRFHCHGLVFGFSFALKTLQAYHNCWLLLDTGIKWISALLHFNISQGLKWELSWQAWNTCVIYCIWCTSSYCRIYASTQLGKNMLCRVTVLLVYSRGILPGFTLLLAYSDSGNKYSLDVSHCVSTGILGTHTRLQAWNLTKYETVSSWVLINMTCIAIWFCTWCVACGPFWLLCAPFFIRIKMKRIELKLEQSRTKLED